MSRDTARRPRRRALSRWVLVPLTVVGLLVLALLALVGVVLVQGKKGPTGDGEYVALGSSFGAGPGITERAEGSPWLCDRSADNYAHLVARSAGLDLSDMTCSGAVTSDVLRGGQYFQGPQLRAVRPTTKLVTITIGGNDVYYLTNLFAWACAQRSGEVPLAYKAAGVCDAHSDAEVESAFAALPDRMTRIVTDIRRTAPDARVVFVDYTTVLPAQGVCAALPITEAQADRARAVAARLEQVTADVARQTSSGLVRASELTKGHDVCSADPWVYGFEWGSNPLSHSVVPFHPREAAMSRIASAVVATLR